MPRQFNMVIDDDLLVAAKRYALEHGTTVSDLARDALAKTIGFQASSTDPLASYAAGAMGRREAMAALGVGYRGLLEALARRGLQVPVLPDPEIRRMADTFTRIWNQDPAVSRPREKQQ